EVRALAQIEARELKSYEVAQRKQERIQQRQGHDHMPSLNLTLKPKGRSAVAHKAKDRYRARDQKRDDRRQDQKYNVTVDRQVDDDDRALRKVFGEAVKARADKVEAGKS